MAAGSHIWPGIGLGVRGPSAKVVQLVKGLLCKREDLSSISSAHIQTAGMVVHFLNPCPGETAAGGWLELTCQPV